MPDSPAPRFTYRAFISYSHRDRAWADWLHKELETWRVPRRLIGTQAAHGAIPRNLRPVFRDTEELASASDLGATVNEALRQSENLIVICSPAAAASRWVNEEVLAYKRMGRGERILCLIVDGEPNASERQPDSVFRPSRESGNPVPATDTLDPQARWIPGIASRFRDDGQKDFPGGTPGREAEECFCPALRCRPGANGQLSNEPTEPIAADARPGKDGKTNAKLKLIAGMLGVGFDALKQREQQRHVRRMAAITALALSMMAVTSALALYALNSRHAAVIAQQAAERRQQQAEDMVGFMLGDLSEKLNQVQRLDVIQSVNDKAMAYLGSLPDTDVNDTALAHRAKTLERIGAVRMDSGDLAGALEAFRASAALSARLAAADPDNAARQTAHSRTTAYIGVVHWNQGKLEDAQRDFEMTRPALERIATRHPSDTSALSQLALLENNLGNVLLSRGQPDAAAAHFHKRLALSQRLVTREPGNNEYLSDLGKAHNVLGRLALQGGDLFAAIGEYRANDAIQSRLWNADRKDNIQRQAMLEARAILGRTLSLAGENAAGRRLLSEAVGIAAQLVQFAPDTTDFRVDLGLYSSQLARLQRLDGNLRAASALNADAVGIFTALTAKDPDNLEWQKYHAETVLELAAQSHAAGNPGDAHQQARQALRILEPILREHPGDHEAMLLVATARLRLADVTPDQGTARALREQALPAQMDIGTRRNDPRLLALHAETLLTLDRTGEAQAVIAQLWKGGYRDAALLRVLQRSKFDYPPNPDFKAKLLAMSMPETDPSSTGPPD